MFSFQLLLEALQEDVGLLKDDPGRSGHHLTITITTGDNPHATKHILITTITFPALVCSVTGV